MNDFYTDAKSAIENVISTKDKVNQQLCEKYNLRSDEVSRRFKSYFGKTIRDAIRDKLTPTKEEVIDALILSNNMMDMKELLGLSESTAIWKGLLDKYFGYSTYASAKANYMIKRKVEAYNPTQADNYSILISQHLGDGHYDEVRGALRIAHGIKQYDYLKFKVGLLNKAFPETQPLTSVKKLTHTQGHEYCSWYSGRLPDRYFNKIVSTPKHELVKEMTPLGWLLYFMDDGGYYLSKEGQSLIMFSTVDEELQNSIIEVMTTYGYKFNKAKTYVCIQNKADAAKFISGMIMPFDHLIPDCMKYKYDMKI